MKLKLSKQIIDTVDKCYSNYYSKLSHVPSHKITQDVLDPSKALQHAQILERYTTLHGKTCLEVGCGFAINFIVWSKKYNLEGYAIEPDGEGFASSFKLARELVKLNGLDPSKILNAVGENIPFENNKFDIVFSSMVLEHVQDPFRVLDECLRVLKPGGIMQICFPNHHSFYEGHYGVLHPPILTRSFLPFYVKWFCRRDPDFAKTIRTELNVFWTKKSLTKLRQKYDFKVITLGEDIFHERITTLNFQAWAGLGIIKKVLNITQKIRLNILLSKLFLITRTWDPIILTIRKNV